MQRFAKEILWGKKIQILRFAVMISADDLTAVNVYDVSNSACRCRFVIGRERPGQQSEVATLIQQTLEQERRQRELLEQQYAQYDADDDEVITTHTHHSLDATARWLPVCA